MYYGEVFFVLSDADNIVITGDFNVNVWRTESDLICCIDDVR